jgi:hypothetical protein
MEQWLSVEKGRTERRFYMILGATRMLSRYKGPGRIVSPTEVTGRVNPLPTMMGEGKVGLRGWGKKTIPGSRVVWYEASESATHAPAASRLTTCMGDGEGKAPAVMETISAPQNRNGPRAWCPARGWKEVREWQSST